MVGLLRPLRKQEREQVPDGEIKESTDDEAGKVQIARLDEAVLFQVLADVRILDGLKWHCPRVNSVLPDCDNYRDEENCQDRQRAHGRAQDAANHRAPTASGQMADRSEEHGTERDAQPTHEAEKVGAIEFIGTDKRQCARNQRENNADHKRALGNFSDYFRRRQIETYSGSGAHFCSSFGPISLPAASGAITGTVAPEPGSA